MTNIVITAVDTIEKGLETVSNQVIKQTEITSKELLGDIKPLSDEEIVKKKNEDEQKKQEEINQLRVSMGQGRNMEQEIEQIRRQKEEDENKKKQSQVQPQQQPVILNTESTNPSKQKKSRGSAFGGKKKKSQPDLQSMSQTSEFKGKID